MIRSAQPKGILLSVPAILLSGVALAHAPVCTAWPVHAVVTFIVGTLLTLSAFASLAGNFAVLPAVRGVTTSGVYRMVRHPAYLGEILLVVACCSAQVDLPALATLFMTIAAVVVRIRAEESLLNATDISSSQRYQSYQAAVTYRLFPGLW